METQTPYVREEKNSERDSLRALISIDKRNIYHHFGKILKSAAAAIIPTATMLYTGIHVQNTTMGGDIIKLGVMYGIFSSLYAGISTASAVYSIKNSLATLKQEKKELATLEGKLGVN